MNAGEWQVAGSGTAFVRCEIDVSSDEHEYGLTMRFRHCQRTNIQALERKFAYLVDQEREERNERRGLEQRAAGLIGALLVALPVSGTVAKEADVHRDVQLAGLILLGCVLIVALVMAAVVAHAIATPRRKRGAVRKSRERVSAALGQDRLDKAVKAQLKIIRAIRDDNARIVTNVRLITRGLPALLVALLVALGLLIVGGDRNGPVPTAASQQESRAADRAGAEQ